MGLVLNTNQSNAPYFFTSDAPWKKTVQNTSEDADSDPGLLEGSLAKFGKRLGVARLEVMSEEKRMRVSLGRPVAGRARLGEGRSCLDSVASSVGGH